MFDREALSRLREQKGAWAEKLQKSLVQNPGHKEFKLDMGEAVEHLYTPLELPGFEYGEKLGLPGEYPFTRGIHPAMYRGRLWTMRQYAGFGTAMETNRRFRYLLEQGQTGLSVAFDLPTQIG